MPAYASSAKIATAEANLGGPIALDSSILLRQLVVALGNVTGGGGGGGSGTVTSVSVTTQNGVSATVTNPTTTPALAFTLGAITPTTVQLSGSVSGTTLLQSPAVAGSAVITFPSITGTLAIIGNPLSQFASTTSAQLAGVISDETGSGSLVFATSPTLVTPVLGTPTSGTLSNCTGLPISTGVSGLGTGVATTLATNLSITGGGTIALGGFTLTVPATGTAALLGTAQTYSAANTFSVNGAASTPAVKLAGTIFTGGSATTTKPLFLIEPTGTTSTGWSTSGTGLGVNAASGFTGNLIDLQTSATRQFSVSGIGTTQIFDAGAHNININRTLGVPALIGNFGGTNRCAIILNGGAGFEPLLQNLATSNVLFGAGSSGNTPSSNASMLGYATSNSQLTFTFGATIKDYNGAYTGVGHIVQLVGGTGSAQTTGGAGGAANITGGAAAGSGNNNGGDVVITGGAKTGSGTAGIIQIASTIKYTVGNSTGAGSALLGANSPASTLTAPYTWIAATSSDGSAVYIPCWK